MSNRAVCFAFAGFAVYGCADTEVRMVNAVTSAETTPDMHLHAPPAWGAGPWIRAVLDGADFAVLATDPHGRVLMAGGAACGGCWATSLTN